MIVNTNYNKESQVSVIIDVDLEARTCSVERYSPKTGEWIVNCGDDHPKSIRIFNAFVNVDDNNTALEDLEYELLVNGI